MTLLRNLIHFPGQPEEREVGIEIELEGRDLPDEEEFNRYWVLHRDGSLRGASCEYVTNRPLPRDRVDAALTYLYSRLEGVEIEDSGRAGIHVHINCQYMTITQLYNFMCTYLILEDLLVDYCGESRKGNHFCLRAKDAEYLVDYLVEIVTTQHWASFATNAIRYASMNVAAVKKFGSLEFRAMRSPVGKEVISTWVKILLALKDYAMKTPDPMEILGQFSYGGVDKFMADVLGENLRYLHVDEAQKQNALEAMWRIQDIVYADVNWKALATDKKKRKRTDRERIEEALLENPGAIPEEPQEVRVNAGERNMMRGFQQWQHHANIQWDMPEDREREGE